MRSDEQSELLPQVPPQELRAVPCVSGEEEGVGVGVGVGVPVGVLVGVAVGVGDETVRIMVKLMMQLFTLAPLFDN